MVLPTSFIVRLGSVADVVFADVGHSFHQCRWFDPRITGRMLCPDWSGCTKTVRPGSVLHSQDG